MSVASHVDPSVKVKIIEGKYVDFAKLIPQDRVMAEEDNQVQLVMKAGSTFFVPAIESNTHISNMT